jgi:low affinity Fe/Cu permease
MRDLFRRFARHAADAAGSPWAFIGGLVIVVIWGLSGPAFNYSDTWQLVINTGTTIATFLMVFLIQNTQNRDSRVIQLKLDELIRALGPARTELVGMDTMTDSELEVLEREFEALQLRAAHGLEKIAASRKMPRVPPGGAGVQ